MANWREIIISGSDADLRSVTSSQADIKTGFTASGIINPNADGTNSQVIQTEGSGNLRSVNKDSGVQGATGAADTQGNDGGDGNQGATGTQGTNDIVRKQETDGNQGTKGNVGTQGATGTQGTDGEDRLK